MQLNIVLRLCYPKKVFKNGTERCYFTAKTYRAKPSDIIINLQADEFNINVTYINKLIKLLKSFKTESVATLMYKTNSSDDILIKIT